MKKSLLVIGDQQFIHGRSLDPSFTALTKHLNNGRYNGNGTEIKIINYKDVFTNNLPQFSGNALRILLFFPFKYWDNNIEIYDDESKVYGDKVFGREFERYFHKLEKKLNKVYRDMTIQYVNPPEASIMDRDKERCKDYFKRHNIPTPTSYSVKTLRDVKKLTERGVALYIKPRFGAMGKGITYLSNDLLITNFLFRKGKIVSHHYDYHWRFHEIKDADRNQFLKILLNRGFIWEEAIDPPIHKGRRSDFRVYYLFGKISYLYVRTTPAVSLVTNWSQGGKIEQKKTFAKYIPESRLKQVKSLVRKVAKALNLNYTGVDVIFSKDYKKIYALEAHSFPGFEKGFDLMDNLADEILNHRHVH